MGGVFLLSGRHHQPKYPLPNFALRTKNSAQRFMNLRTFNFLILSLFHSFTSFAAAQLVYSGTIGQTNDKSEPIAWLSCAWCVTDAQGTVHLPEGWKLQHGGGVAREVNDVPGQVFSDGEGNLFYFYQQRAELGTVVVAADGLHKGAELARAYHWNLVWHAAPASCNVGFATNAHRFFALDRKKREVHAWRADGTDAGVVFSYAARKEDFRSLAIHPASGDLLLGEGWPANSVHRFHVDGSEVKNAFWPYHGYALTLKNIGRETWVLGSDAACIVENLSPELRTRFGKFSNEVYDIAATAEGFVLATTQGAQFYNRNDLKHCAKRVGGLSGVTAMATHAGRLLVCAGYRMLNFWTDDIPGDLITSEVTATVAKHWDEVVDKIEVRDDVFYMNDKVHGRVIAYDPRVTEWVFRAKRQYDVTNVTVKADSRLVRVGKRCAAWAKDDALELYERGADKQSRLVTRLPYVATYLAAEGDWLFAYVPERKAILRFKLTEN